MKKYMVIFMPLFLFSLFNIYQPAFPLEKYEVTVTLKLIPVIVVDEKGNPVQGLRKEDFLLKEDRRRVEIAAFEAHFFDEEKRLEKESPIPAQAATSPGKARKFFLLFDYSQSDLWGIKKAKQLGEQFIDALRPDDKISIISYSRDKGLVFYLFLSADHQKAKGIIQELAEIPTIKRTRKRADESWLRSQTEQVERQWLHLKAINFVSGLGELAKILAYVPGNKNIILFSGGTPRYYLYENRSLPDSFNLQEIKPGLFDRFIDLGRTLGSAGCRVFAINANRHEVNLSSSSWERGDDSLQILTDHSGGKYFPNITATERLVEDLGTLTGSYYVLGYYVEEKRDGQYHPIEIKLKGKRKDKFRLYYQKGYFNPRPYAELSAFEKKLNLFMLATEGKSAFFPQIEFPAQAFLAAEERGKKRVFLKLDLTGLKKQEFFQGMVELIIFILDEKGYILQIKRRKLLWEDLPNDQLVIKFSLSPGRYRLRIVFRSIKEGKEALSTVQVNMAKKSYK